MKEGRGEASEPSCASAARKEAIPADGDQLEEQPRGAKRPIREIESDRESVSPAAEILEYGAESGHTRTEGGVTAEEGEEARKRPRRSRAPIRNYSETKRRKPQEPRPAWKAYMNSSKRAGKAARKDRLHTRIAWGQVTVDRIVQGRYEWHDGRLSKRLRRNRQTRVYDDGG